MNLKVGIIGLPNVGKSTLFKALTRQKVDISNYPFCTIDPNIGIVKVPDNRLLKIAEIIKPEKVTPSVIEFVDIAGLVKNAHKGEGLGNQFLSYVREVNAICEVVRIFSDEKVSHVEGNPDPKRDIEIIKTELIMKDLETIENHLIKLKKQSRTGDKNAEKSVQILEKMRETLNDGTMLNDIEIGESKELIKELGLLTAKPIIYVFNADKSAPNIEKKLSPNTIYLNLQLECEMSDLNDEEKEELDLPHSKLPELIKMCYKALGLITFFSIAKGKETRAWPIKKGTFVPQAGGIIHSDFEEKFIKAEVINWEKLIQSGSWNSAREKGLIRIEGKNYIVQDGDVIEFKI